jgi:hypothetical protein
MDPLDVSSPSAAAGTLLWLVGGALGLKPAVFVALKQSAHGLGLALLVLVLAGASRTLGQSAVLFFNRIPPRRFLVAMVVGGVEFALAAMVWIGSVWIMPRLLGSAPPSLGTAVTVIGLSYAPLLFSFVELAPYGGAALGRLLRVWALLASIVGIAIVFDVRPLTAAVIAALGFVLERLVEGLGGQIPDRIERWLWRLKSGRETQYRTSELLALIEQRQRGEELKR